MSNTTTPTLDLVKTRLLVEAEDYATYRLGKALYVYLSLCLMLVGLTGNVISFVVLSKRSKDRQPTYFYLTVLSLVDALALYIPGLRGWLKYMAGDDLMLVTRCSWYIIVYFSVCNISVYIIVCVTMNRVLHTYFPLSARRLVFDVLFWCHFNFFNRVGLLLDIWSVVLSSYIRRIRLRQLVVGYTKVVYEADSNLRSNHNNHDRVKTCLSSITLLFRYFYQQVALHFLITAVFEHLMYLNNCLNFVLYFLRGSQFREELAFGYKMTRICPTPATISGSIIPVKRTF
ncbi:hypothetical protein LSH36_404g00027 [Paralvinella palmiformis]|uniref:G-protein coupled receptors family 1 profile domain-containing protein n=1 Tax=Paralvinella palmiformis TaxID=53620 RepID=A0AAD9JCU8_9ANNE|nr:hypothetical protein LSH36_404g00027 [Paralvinella palmiformis]